jgi:hypothetical protein
MEWFRTYQTDVDDYVLQQLPAEVYRFYGNLRCLASNGDGILPPLPAILYRCHKTEAEALEFLAILSQPTIALVQEIEPGVLVLTRWAKEQRSSDNSAPRVAKLREKQRQEALAKCANDAVTLQHRYCNGLETETEQKQNRENLCASGDACVGDAVPPSVPGKTSPEKRKSRKNGLLSPLSQEQQEKFEQFWSAYWRKKDRVPSQWAFHDLIGDSDERFQGLMAAMERDREEMMRRQPDKRPYGATYIHKQPWQDGEEPEPPQQTQRTEKTATSFRPKDPAYQTQPETTALEVLTPDRIRELQDQLNDPNESEVIRKLAAERLAQYKPEVSPWRN